MKFPASVAFVMAVGLPFMQAHAQARVADLEQDVAALRAQLGDLRTAIETLQRENAELHRALATQTANTQQAYATLQQLNSGLASIRAEFAAADLQVRKDVSAEVARQMEALAAQMQDAINKAAAAQPARPAAPAQPVTFTDDFPKTGITYTIQPGDTLSGIAKKLGSTVRDIQNANKIADPRAILPGEKLFIPQAK